MSDFISVEFPKEIERKLFRQVDFALITTFTRSVALAQRKVREGLPDRFNLTNTFVLQGIRIDPATKKDPQAYVYVQTEGEYSLDFMVLQETGGVKLPHGRYLAVPVSIKRRRGKRGANTGIIADENRPRELIERGEYKSTRGRTNRVFVIDERTKDRRHKHDLPYGIYAAHPKRKGRHIKGEGLTMLYAFERKADIDERFEFIDTATTTIQDNLGDIFEDALIKAVQTAR